MTARTRPGLRGATWGLGLLVALLACGEGERPPHGRASAPRVTRFGGASMGTTFTVQALGLPPGVERPRLAADVARILDGIDRAMSTWRTDSELARFNAEPGTDWFEVAEDTWLVATEARAVAALSAGALDVTLGPLVDLWGFGRAGRRAELPAPAALAAARARVGWQHLELGDGVPALRKTRPDLSVDLSALAKGHAVDRIAAHLGRLGVESWLVEFGGELAAHGLDLEGRPWRVGIEHPDGRHLAPVRVLELDDGAVATSGDARNAFELDGRRYGHVLDPRSGRPVEHGLLAVSVVAATALRADALATALFVLGPEEGRALAEAQGLAAVFLLREGGEVTCLSTPALAGWLASDPSANRDELH